MTNIDEFQIIKIMEWKDNLLIFGSIFSTSIILFSSKK